MSSISSSIASALGIGGGIDSGAIVSQLVAATRAPKENVLTGRLQVNNARISALASASSSLDTFSKALNDLLSGIGFSGQPVSNDPSIATVSLLPGGVPAGLPAQIEVVRLASAQTLVSANISGAVGTGTLALTTSKGSFNVEITSATATLADLASAINVKDSGVTASVVTDNQGSRLVLKGATGEDNAFTLTTTSTDGLERFAYSTATPTMEKKQDALDSHIRVDNIDMYNGTNIVDTAIPYVRIDLNKAAPGTSVTLASNEPTKTVRDLVVEFVTAYNTLRSALNAATASGVDASTAGALAGDAGMRDMMKQLSRLTSTQLADSGPYRTLADLGISTNRDGTLKMDLKKLDAVIAANPSAVTQMLNPAVSTDTAPGIAKAMQKVRDSLQADGGALAASKAKYAALQASLADQLEKLDTEMDNYEARLSQTFANMDRQLTALKATQTYLEQQIAVWNNKND